MTTEQIQLKSQELIKVELEKLILNSKIKFQEIKRVTVDEAWKILQLAAATVIQIIEAIGDDLAGIQKKEIAMQYLNKFYDSVFVVVDIPFVPNLVEPIIHRYVKTFLMILLGASIDALVTTFRNTGIFLKKELKDTTI